jgi:hypothetical protein
MAPKQNWIGRRYGQLVIVGEFKGRNVLVKCDCDPSTLRKMDRFNVAYGKVVNCGHKQQRHGMTGSPEWRSWKKMFQRCDKPQPHQVNSYRNVTVCPRWLLFNNFYVDMGPKPTPKHTIDRYPDPAGNYEPGNCRWATMTEQNMNKRKRGSLKEAA